MAITYVEQKKTQNNLIFILLAVLLITGLIVWWGFFRKKELVPIEQPAVSVKKQIQINLDVLKSDFFNEPQPFGTIQPLEEGIPIGRENPFLPL